MNEKEVGEIRRRFRPDKSNISHVCGCFINENREIVSRFDQSLAVMPQEESEKILTVLRKSLSGTLGKNLVDLSFSTQQVVEGEEHKLLMALRESALNDQEIVESFYQKVIEALHMEGQYLILLAYDRYDVPYRSKDGQRQDDAATEVYSYILCCVCPIKMTKPALCYYVPENIFHNLKPDWLVAPPELGFLFPAFDDRSANIYDALYYTKDSGENHPEFIEAVFSTEAPPPAAVQRETFQSILGETLAEDCNLEVVQSVHDQLQDMIEEHKANKEEEPLAVSKTTVKGVLKACGVSDEHMEAFEERYDQEFGADTQISPRNLVDGKPIEICTPDVVIRVNPERSELVETRIINGTKYILIRAGEGVEVNGVDIHIS